MTSITVVKKNGYVAIAADTLTKWGYSKEPAEYIANHEKIIKVGSSYIGVASSVTTDLALRIHFAKLGAKAKLNSVEDIFSTWNELHRVLKERYFLNSQENEDRSYESSRMDVLIANPYGIFGVGPYRSVQEFTKFYAYGSGGDYAQGAMYTIYEDANRSAEEIARLGVQAAAEFDEDTGLPINSYAIKLRK
jgi:ATP-dependent protease HslVU (ClpYQ) peptidase subunit